MSNKFDIKKFLNENKLTPSSRKLNEDQGADKIGEVGDAVIYALEGSSLNDTMMYRVETPRGSKDIGVEVDGETAPTTQEIASTYSIPNAVADLIQKDIAREFSQMNEEEGESNSQMPAENMKVSAALSKAGIQPADQVELRSAEGIAGLEDGVYEYGDAVKELEELIQKFSRSNTPMWDFSAGEWSDDFPLSLQAPEEEDILIKKADEVRRHMDEQEVEEQTGGLGSKAAQEFIEAAENGVGIEEFIESMLADYKEYYGNTLEDEGLFQEASPEDIAIFKAAGHSDLVAGAAGMYENKSKKLKGKIQKLLKE